MVKIIPSPLTSSPSELKEFVNLTDDAHAKDPSRAKRIQIDIVDGIFADNKTLRPDAMRYIETNVLIDFHLMVKEPVNWVESCVQGLADRIFGHIELMQSIDGFIEKVSEVGAKIGLALDLKTHMEAISADQLKDVDSVLLLGVPAGFDGQKFDNSVIEKIKKLDEIRKSDQSPFTLAIDGGITIDNIKSVTDAGIDEVCIGKRLFHGDLLDNIKRFENAASR